MTKQNYTMFIETIWSKVEALVHDYKQIWKSVMTHFTPRKLNLWLMHSEEIILMLDVNDNI